MGVLDKVIRKPELVDFHDDDVEVIRSWVEYSEDRSMMRYLLYEMQVRDHDGTYRHFYKAIKFLRVIRLPKDSKQETRFIDMATQMLSGFYSRSMNWIVVMANMIHPVPLGLLHLYGVQAVADTADEAKRYADNDFAALQASLQGSFRVMEFRPINYDELEWLREKMFGMKHLTVIRGIPEAKRSAAEGKMIGWGGNSSPGAQGTAEDFVAGMAGREYVLVVLSSAVTEETLNRWRAQTAKEMTFWSGHHQGVRSISAGVSLPFIFASNLGQSSGWSHQTSDTTGFTHGVTESFAHSVGHGVTNTESVGQSLSSSEGVNTSESVGSNQSFTHSANLSHSEGTTDTVTHGWTAGVTESHSVGTSHTVGTSEQTGISDSLQQSDSVGTSHSTGTTDTATHSANTSTSKSHTDTSSQGDSYGLSTAKTTGTTQGQSLTHTDSQNVSGSMGASQQMSVNESVGFMGTGVGSSQGFGMNESVSAGLSSSNAEGTSAGYSEGQSQGATQSTTTTNGASDSVSSTRSEGFSSAHGTSTTDSVSQSQGQSSGRTLSSSFGKNESFGVNTTDSQSQSYSASQSVSRGVSKSDTYGEGISSSVGTTNTLSQGKNYQVSQGLTASQSRGTTDTVSDTVTKGTSDSTSRSQGLTRGTNEGITQGTTASGGIGPSLSFGKTYQWEDQEVAQILKLLEYQSNRLMAALSGQGAFFVDIMVATPDEQTKASAQSLARTAWMGEETPALPLQVMDLSREEESHLLYHFNAFSPCNARENFGKVTSYRYSTVLLSKEAVAYAHPLRISEGGIFADVESIPILAVPSMRQGPIYLGKIISGERWTPTMGYKTPFDFRLENDELHHGLWCGESRSGKTEAALRFTAEVANKVRLKNGKRYRIIAMDPKRDWRRLGRFVEPERFRFYSLANLEMNPIRLNLCKIPKGVFPQFYLDGLVEVFCRAYQLNERGREILTDALSGLYDEEGVFVENWREVAPERSARVSMTRLYERVRQMKVDLEDPSKGFGRAGNADREAMGRVLERLKVFSRKYTIESMLFGQATDMGIDDLLGKDDVIVLESYGLESTFRNFVFGLITNGIFQYAQAHPNGFYSDEEYPTILMIEEANEVLTGNNAEQGNVGLPGASAFERILDQSAGLGLFVHAITQKPADVPPSIIANSGLVFAGKLSRQEDLQLIVLKLGRDPRRQDIELLKWFPRSPVGWLVCRSSRNYDFKQIEPSLVAIDRLEVSNPTDEELKAILGQAKVAKEVKASSVV